MTDLDLTKQQLFDILKDKWRRMNSLYYIIDKHANRVKFQMNAAQQTLFENMWHMNIILKDRQRGCCLDPEIRVLTSDLRWVPIGEIKVGERVVAADEYPPGGRGIARRMQTALVEGVRIVLRQAYKIVFDDGRFVICTDRHPWLSKKVATDASWRCLNHTGFKNADKKNINLNTKVRSLTHPWGPSTLEDYWFGGMLDGEGSMVKKDGANLSVCQVQGPVWDRLEAYLKNSGWNYRIERDEGIRPSKFGSRPVHKLTLSRMDEIFNALGRCRPTRFLNNEFWIDRELPRNGWHRIVEIEKLNIREMVDLQTSTGTYIAEGFVSHNTTLVCLLYLDDCLFYDNIEAGIIAHKEADAIKIFRRKVKYPYDNLPDQIKAQKRLMSKRNDELSFPNNSIIFVSTSMRSGTVNRLLLCMSGDTDVFTKHGYVKKIKDVTIGDKVICSKGSYRTVKGISKSRLSDLNKKLLKITVFGHYQDLKLTEDHKVLTREFKTGDLIWKKANELTKNDYLAIPIREPSMKLRDGRLPIGGWRSKNKIPVNYDFGYLVGLYLAEGNIRRSELIIAGDRKEDDKRLEFLKKFEQYFDSVSVYHHKNSRTSSIRVNSRSFCDFMADKFILNGDKYIPDSVWCYGRKFLDGLIKGYFDGDGHYINTNREVRVCGIRRQIIDQLRLILISLRFGVASIYYKKSGVYYNRNCKEQWTLVLSGVANWKFRKYFDLPLPEFKAKWPNWRIDNGFNPGGRKFWRRGRDHYWTKIKSIAETEDEEFVYDIVLDKVPHNYLTTTGIVHNSEFGKVCAKFPEKATEIISGSLEAIHQEGDGHEIVWVESTAEGREGYFYDYCMEAMKLEQEKRLPTRMEFKSHFFGWTTDPEKRTEEEIPISAGHAKYFADLEKKLHIKLDDEQKWWYVAKAKIQRHEMKKENPATPEEAFAAAIEGAYYAEQLAEMRDEGRLCHVPFVEGIHVDTYWDLGWDDSTTIWFGQDVGREIHLIDYYEANHSGLLHYGKILHQKACEGKWVYGRHWGPHDTLKHELGPGKHLATQARELRDPITEMSYAFNFSISPKIKSEAEGYEAVRSIFHRLWFDQEKTTMIIKLAGKEKEVGLPSIENYRQTWDEKREKFDDKPLKNWASHGAKALETLAMSHKMLGSIPNADKMFG